MSQNGVKFDGTDYLVNSQLPDTGLVNGAVVRNGCSAAGSRISRRAFAGIVNKPKPPRLVNGFINHGFNGKSTKAADTVALPVKFDPVVPDPSFSASGKKQRRKKFRHKKRKPVTCPETSAPPLPPREEENWENDTVEVTLTDWETICCGFRPYGPEDVLQFALRDMTLQQRDPVNLPATANYSPAVHHQRPVRWSYCYAPTEPGQFVDAEE